MEKLDRLIDKVESHALYESAVLLSVITRHEKGTLTRCQVVHKERLEDTLCYSHDYESVWISVFMDDKDKWAHLWVGYYKYPISETNKWLAKHANSAGLPLLHAE